eukprot:gene23174-31494_t
MEVEEGTTVVAKEPEAIDGDEEIDELSASFALIEASLQDQSKIDDYRTILSNPREDDTAFKIKEQCIYRLAKLFTQAQKISDVISLIETNSAFFNCLPKARTAKIVRTIINIVAATPSENSLEIQVTLCRSVIATCVKEKRTFLRQRVEAKLASLLLQQKKPVEALELVDSLLKELKKLDDKQMLTETHLTEARIYHALQNIPKSKASLTASRTAANAIYVVPLLQAEIDEMSGILCCEEADYTTAYSYFLEAFDAYDQANHASAVSVLKYLVLCKVLNEAAGEVGALLSTKMAMKHAGIDLEAMAAIAKAAKSRSLEDFKEAVMKYDKYLKTDELISHHLDVLYDKMMESNLLKIISPYSCVELAHVATIINLPEIQVIHKLSQMILDRKLFGILDQGKGHLIVYDSSENDDNYGKGVEIIANMGLVVEALFTRAKGLSKTVV